MFFSLDDPFLPVDWRWQRAVWLVENTGTRRAASDVDDPYVRLAKRFRRRWNRTPSPAGQQKLCLQFPGVYYAWQIYKRSDCDDRWNIEARLLAGQDPAEIAQRQKCKPEVIFWFEKLFFNVSDKLNHRDYLVNRVLGPAVHRGITERDFDLLLKLFALVGGPLVVDILMENNSRIGSQLQSHKHADAFFSELTGSVQRRKAAVAAYCMPVSPRMQIAILEGHAKLLELERAQERAASNTEGLTHQGIVDALAALPFRTVSSKNPPTLILQAPENTAVELTGRQRIAAAAGTIIQVEPEFHNFRIPLTPPNTPVESS